MRRGVRAGGAPVVGVAEASQIGQRARPQRGQLQLHPGLEVWQELRRVAAQGHPRVGRGAARRPHGVEAADPRHDLRGDPPQQGRVLCSEGCEDAAGGGQRHGRGERRRPAARIAAKPRPSHAAQERGAEAGRRRGLGAARLRRLPQALGGRREAVHRRLVRELRKPPVGRASAPERQLLDELGGRGLRGRAAPSARPSAGQPSGTGQAAGRRHACCRRSSRRGCRTGSKYLKLPSTSLTYLEQ